MKRAWLVAGPGEEALTNVQRTAMLADLTDDEADLRREAASTKVHPQNAARCLHKADLFAAALHGLDVELPAAIARAEKAEAEAAQLREQLDRVRGRLAFAEDALADDGRRQSR